MEYAEIAEFAGLQSPVPGFDPRRRLVKVGIALPSMVSGLGRDLLLSWMRGADEGPFSVLGVGERVGYPNLEMMTTLAAAAAVTERIGIEATVSVTPMHSAVLVAKQAATIDVLSGGRFTLGVGVGAWDEDYRLLDASFEHGQRAPRRPGRRDAPRLARRSGPARDVSRRLPAGAAWWPAGCRPRWGPEVDGAERRLGRRASWASTSPGMPSRSHRRSASSRARGSEPVAPAAVPPVVVLVRAHRRRGPNVSPTTRTATCGSSVTKRHDRWPGCAARRRLPWSGSSSSRPARRRVRRVDPRGHHVVDRGASTGDRPGGVPVTEGVAVSDDDRASLAGNPDLDAVGAAMREEWRVRGGVLRP